MADEAFADAGVAVAPAAGIPNRAGAFGESEDGVTVFVDHEVLDSLAESLSAATDKAFQSLPDRGVMPAGSEPRSTSAANAFNARAASCNEEICVILNRLFGYAQYIRDASAAYDRNDEDGAQRVRGGGQSGAEFVSTSARRVRPPVAYICFVVPEGRDFADAAIYAEALETGDGTGTGSAEAVVKSIEHKTRDALRDLDAELAHDILRVRESWKPVGAAMALVLSGIRDELAECASRMEQLRTDVDDYVHAFETVQKDHPLASEIREARARIEPATGARDRKNFSPIELFNAQNDYLHVLKTALKARAAYEYRVADDELAHKRNTHAPDAAMFQGMA
ncbi:hypothetical protein [Nocardia yamanashiensis]|uniref:hypothetical protein n=1 Tax=Nocardia yamanashiensis TaxID=209247 RepID=UPI00082F03D3|nr:hypothetical protein [Nocardia yamanashiensis]